MALLVIDTSLSACQVGIFEGGRRIAGASEAMERGHQERLAPMTAEMMAGARLTFGEVGKIAATVGPGSFTGLRVGMAFAKGLRLATGAGLAGVGTLAALAAGAAKGGVSAGVIDARRGQLYWQAFQAGRPLDEPRADPIAHVAQKLQGAARIVGPGAALLRGLVDGSELVELAAPDLDALGRLGEAAAPAPDLGLIYLRPPVAPPAAP